MCAWRGAGPFVEYIGVIPPAERAEAVARLQAAVDDMIATDIPTQVANGTRGSEVMATLGVPDAFLAPYPDDRELRIVAVGGPGCACPCGGTHVLSTGQLRGLTITKVRGRRSGLVAWSWAHCLRVCVCVWQIKCKKGKTKVSYTVA